MTTYQVKLYVYDITNGMAKQFAPMLIGKQVEGVWHSSVVVYNKEFYYSGGICYDHPKTTQFGTPVKEIDLGETEITILDFEAYIKDIEGEYTFEKYHIFKNNCNHFANSVAEFLIGEGIPDWILKQGDEFENTPIGKMLEGFQVNMNGNQNNYNLNNISQQKQQQQQPKILQSKEIVEILDLTQYFEMISGNDRVIIDFYADWCKPCHMIKPVYAQLAEQNRGNIKFCSINVDKLGTKELCSNLKISAMPTFVTIFKGDENERLQGANQQKLRDLIERLKNK